VSIQLSIQLRAEPKTIQPHPTKATFARDGKKPRLLEFVVPP